MKRVYVAVVLLAGLGAFCAVGCIQTASITDELSAALTRVEALAHAADYPAARKEMGALVARYKDQEHILAVYMSRTQTAAVAIALSTVESYLDEEHSQDLQAEMERARAQLYAMRHLFFSLF